MLRGTAPPTGESPPWKTPPRQGEENIDYALILEADDGALLLLYLSEENAKSPFLFRPDGGRLRKLPRSSLSAPEDHQVRPWVSTGVRPEASKNPEGLR